MKSMFHTADYVDSPINMELYNLVDAYASVLDVGCGNSLLAQKLMKDKHCEVTGIDTSFYGDGICSKFIYANVEDLPTIEKTFNIILFSDSLEHFKNPDKVLLWARRLLKHNGKIMLSIPNVANWQVRLNLLFGRFNYDCGLLDWGHLRFFTLNSIKEMLEWCCYRVDKVYPRNRWIGFLSKVFPGLFAFQFIVVARKDS